MKEIPLTQGYIAQVSDEDYDALSSRSWYPIRNRTTVYAYTKIDGKDTPMHQLILGGSPDHKDHNGLNNQRENLRPASQSQNLMNMSKTTSPTSSKFKGVCWHKKAQKWMASIKLHGHIKYLGLFDVEEDAAKAYDIAAQNLFGEFANPNFKEGAQ